MASSTVAKPAMRRTALRCSMPGRSTGASWENGEPSPGDAPPAPADDSVTPPA
jgi:hypothetical protein